MSDTVFLAQKSMAVASPVFDCVKMGSRPVDDIDSPSFLNSQAQWCVSDVIKTYQDPISLKVTKVGAV